MGWAKIYEADLLITNSGSWQSNQDSIALAALYYCFVSATPGICKSDPNREYASVVAFPL